MYEDPGYVYETMRHGASGYLLKDICPEELIRALRVIKAGEGYLQSEIARPVLKQLAFEAKIEKGSILLTARELEILQLAANGKANKEIAAQLFIGEETVKTHLKNIFEKLGASARTHAVAIALRQNLIE